MPELELVHFSQAIQGEIPQELQMGLVSGRQVLLKTANRHKINTMNLLEGTSMLHRSGNLSRFQILLVVHTCFYVP